MGATGKERIEAINHFFKQIIDILIPVHMKYLLWAASEGILKFIFFLKSLIGKELFSTRTLSSPSEKDDK